MSKRHLKTGDALPELSPGVLRLYSMAFCPFAERTRLVLAAKGIDYELVNVNTYEKPEWFFEKNPDGLVPVLERDGKVVEESLVTCEYLDELYPKTAPMLPSDPYLRAKDKVFIQRFGNKYSSSMFKSARAKGADEELRSALLKEVEAVENELKNRGTDFFSGSAPGLVDYAIWPFIYRTTALGAIGVGEFPESFTILRQWVERMRTHEIIAPRMMEASALREFTAHYRTANTRFDDIDTKTIA